MTAAPAIYWQSIVINHQKHDLRVFLPVVFLCQSTFFIYVPLIILLFSLLPLQLYFHLHLPWYLRSASRSHLFLLCFSRKRDNDPIFFHSKTLTDDLYIFLDLAAVDLV